MTARLVYIIELIGFRPRLIPKGPAFTVSFRYHPAQNGITQKLPIAAIRDRSDGSVSFRDESTRASPPHRLLNLKVENTWVYGFVVFRIRIVRICLVSVLDLFFRDCAVCVVTTIFDISSDLVDIELRYRPTTYWT